MSRNKTLTKFNLTIFSKSV